MIRQDGKLIILPSKITVGKQLEVGTYFMLKLGQNAIRFNSIRGNLELNVRAADWDTNMEFIIFRRRPRLKNDLLGCRRRDVLDQDFININKLRPKALREYYVVWKSVELNSLAKDVQFIVDIEFFPSSGPIIPLKSPQSPSEKSSPVIKTKLPKQLPQSPESKPATTPRDQESSPKFFPRLRRHSRHQRRNDLNIDSDDIVYDNVIIYDGKEKAVVAGNYTHGLKSYEAESSDTSGVYSFIEQNKEKIRNYDYDTLVIKETPKDLLNNEYAHLQLGDKLMFIHSFPSANVKLTGYLGNGRWSVPETNETRRQLYVLQQPTLPPPRVPPKCPKGMLWEEYYLLNKEKYIREVMRN